MGYAETISNQFNWYNHQFHRDTGLQVNVKYHPFYGDSSGYLRGLYQIPQETRWWTTVDFEDFLCRPIVKPKGFCDRIHPEEVLQIVVSLEVVIRGCQVEFRVASSVPVAIQVDHGCLYMVIHNTSAKMAIQIQKNGGKNGEATNINMVQPLDHHLCDSWPNQQQPRNAPPPCSQAKAAEWNSSLSHKALA